MGAIRGRRRGSIALALAAACLLLGAPGWASAATGTVGGLTDTEDIVGTDPVGDTVTTTVKDVLKPVRDAAKPVVDPVDKAAAPVRQTVDQATKPVTDAVGDAAEPVTDTVGEVTDPVRTVVDPPRVRQPGGQGRTPRTSPAPLGTRSGPAEDGARTSGPRTRTESRRGRSTAAPAPVRPRAFDRDATPAAVDQRVAGAPARDVSALDRFGRAAVDASRAFRFPLLVAALVLLFLGIQARVDARDPKLAAPATDEELTFA